MHEIRTSLAGGFALCLTRAPHHWLSFLSLGKTNKGWKEHQGNFFFFHFFLHFSLFQLSMLFVERKKKLSMLFKSVCFINSQHNINGIKTFVFFFGKKLNIYVQKSFSIHVYHFSLCCNSSFIYDRILPIFNSKFKSKFAKIIEKLVGHTRVARVIF